MRLNAFVIGVGLFIAATVALIWESNNFRYEGAEQLTVRTDPREKNIVVFSWSGPIEPPMQQQLSEEFQNWKEKASHIILELNSPGGAVTEGEKVIKVIRRMKRTHVVETYVGRDSACLSMCVPIYLQGRLRVAAASSNWMFHEPSSYDVFTGDASFTFEHEDRQSANEVFQRYFVRSEIDERWRENLEKQTRLGEVWKTGRELKEERSNIVTVLEE